MKTMLHYDGPGSTQLAIICGMIGGLGKYLLQINNAPYLENLGEAALTALICGAAGVAGKEGYQAIKPKAIKFWQRIKKRRNEKVV